MKEPVYVVAASDEQYALFAKMFSSEMYRVEKIRSNIQLRGIKNSRVFYLPDSRFTLPASENREIVMIARLNGISIYDISRTKFNNMLKEHNDAIKQLDPSSLNRVSDSADN